jgi:hypothetical protein
MKRFTLLASAALACLAPSAAAAKPPTRAHVHAYQRDYGRVVHALGHRAPGRNIVKDGIGKGRRASDSDVVSSLTVLVRMLAPPPVTPAAVQPAAVQPAAAQPTAPTQSSAPTESSAAAPAPATGSTAGASGVPSCASESGTNYSTGAANTNGSSGATGRYQITPSTAANYGCNLATPSGQDACAQTIYKNQGAGAWVGCGG